MKNLFFIPAILSFFLLCCTNQGKQKNDIKVSEKYKTIEKANWLTGEWQKRSVKGVLTEKWHKLDDSTMVGQSYILAGNDTLSFENVTLEQRNGTVSYVPLVKGQNNGQAVYFTLTSSTDSSLVFENPQHDFPQKITYTKIANDSLLAVVSAMVEGKMKSNTFRMGRLTKPSTVE